MDGFLLPGVHDPARGARVGAVVVRDRPPGAVVHRQRRGPRGDGGGEGGVRPAVEVGDLDRPAVPADAS